jgi:hypothetical protein
VPLETNPASFGRNTVCEPLACLTGQIAAHPLRKHLLLETAMEEDTQEQSVTVLARRNASAYVAGCQARVMRLRC